MRSTFYIIFLIAFSLFSCQPSKSEMSTVNETAEAHKALKVIFDTDMGSDCDDVGALALLHHYQNEGKVEILACIYSSGKIPYGAGVIQAINGYYGRSDIPIGAAHDTLVGDHIDKMGAEKLAKDTSTYGHNIIINKDADEQTVLNRKILAEQEDNSVIYITVGHTKGLYDLLVSKSDTISPLYGEAMITQKIKHWVALGALNANDQDKIFKKDWNFFFNGTAPYTEYLVKNFPRPIYFVDGGGDVMTGKTLAETPEGNIVRTAYRDWLSWYGRKTLADQRPSWDLVTVYYAIIGLGDYFKNAKEGWLDIDAEKGSLWKYGPNSYQHYYIMQKEGTDSLFAQELNEKIALLPKPE